MQEIDCLDVIFYYSAMMNRIRQHVALPSFFLGLFLTFISCIGYYSFGNQKPALLSTLDHRIMDLMFNIRGAQPVTGRVIIVDVDEKSIKALGQWPWPRNILARITDNLTRNDVSAIGFDIMFPEKDRASPLYYFQNLDNSLQDKLGKAILTQLVTDKTLDYDSLLADALSRGPSVLGYAFQLKDDGQKSDADLPFPSSEIQIIPESIGFKNLGLIPAYRAVVNHPTVAMAESEGFFNVFTDETGTTRQVPLLMVMDDIPYPSLALETFRIGMKMPSITIQASQRIKAAKATILGIHMGNIFIPTDTMGQVLVNYRGPSYSFRYISAIDIINTPSQPFLKDKFVLIGSSSVGLFDLRTSPFSSAIPGIEINATVIDNLIQADPFTYDIYTEIGLTYMLIMAGGLLLTLILSILGPLAGGFTALLFFVTSYLLNYHYFFLNNRHIGITYPMITCAAILLIISIFNTFQERKTKRFIQNAFSRYVAPDVVAGLLKNPTSLSLAGEERELTVLFCDIRNFTSISEKMTPRDLGIFMNDFLTTMSRIIMKNGGTVDKFIGDAIMAFWGAPKRDPNHADKAVHTALELISALTLIRKKYENSNFFEIMIGIGINSGVMSVGNFGSMERFDYTVMGDNVNLASRLEGANKSYGTAILISKATKKMTHDKYFSRYIDKVQVKGREEAVDLYEPLLKGVPPKELQEEVLAFERGIKAYQEQDFKKAHQIMNKLYKEHLNQLYHSFLVRIEGFLISPPPADWNGAERRSGLPVNRLTTK